MLKRVFLPDNLAEVSSRTGIPITTLRRLKASEIEVEVETFLSELSEAQLEQLEQALARPRTEVPRTSGRRPGGPDDSR